MVCGVVKMGWNYRTADSTEKDGICRFASSQSFVGQGVVVFVYRALMMSDSDYISMTVDLRLRKGVPGS